MTKPLNLERFVFWQLFQTIIVQYPIQNHWNDKTKAVLKVPLCCYYFCTFVYVLFLHTQTVKATTVVNVQVPAHGVNMSCNESVVATHSEARCSATVTAGTRLNFKVDWNDGQSKDLFPTAGTLEREKKHSSQSASWIAISVSRSDLID